MQKFLIKYYKILIIAISFYIFYVLLRDVLASEVIKVDELGYKFIYTYLRNKYLTNIFIVISFMVSPIVVLGITSISWIVIKNKKLPLLMSINLVIITLLNQIAKRIICRPRPPYKLVEESGFSFPSGHSMVSFAFYGFIIFLIFLFIKNKKHKTIYIVLLSLLIFSVGVSRVYLGVHYGSDVLAGFVFSLAYLMIYTTIVKDYLLKEK